jgi:hypothetical protein
MDDQPFQANLGLSRRTLLKRSAVVGGTLVWAAPVVQTLAKPAFAAGGSSPCHSTTCTNVFKNKKQTILLGHQICAPQPQDRDCPCECVGLPGTKCSEADPCTVVITCTGLLPGPCPTP